MRSRERLWSNPNALRSHITTQMTTTAFKIDLIELDIGMKRLISHRMTTTAIKVNNTWTKGMNHSLILLHALLIDWQHHTRIEGRNLFTCAQFLILVNHPSDELVSHHAPDDRPSGPGASFTLNGQAGASYMRCRQNLASGDVEPLLFARDV
jgi:hypothetical protein